MTECCLFVCCRPSTSSRLVASQYSPHASGNESDLKPLKMKTLLAYSSSYPRKLPSICSIIEKRITGDCKKNKKGFVNVGFQIFKDMCIELRNHDVIDIIEPHYRRCVELVLCDYKNEYLSIAYEAFVDYTDHCINIDVRDFVVPIEIKCLEAKSCLDVETPILCLKFMLRLINVMMHRVGEIEAHLDVIVPIVYYYYANAAPALSVNHGPKSDELYVDDGGSLTVRAAAKACLLALSLSPTASTLVHTISVLFSVFDQSSWEPQDVITAVLNELTSQSAKTNLYQVPIAHLLITHARNIALGTSSSFSPAAPVDSSPVPRGSIISSPHAFSPTFADLPPRTLQGSEAALRTLRAKCFLLRNVLSSAAEVLETECILRQHSFRPMLLHLEDDWMHFIALLNYSSSFIVDVCPPLMDRILGLAERCVSGGGHGSMGSVEKVSFAWMSHMTTMCMTSTANAGGLVVKQDSFDAETMGSTHDNARAVLSVVECIIRCMKTTMLGFVVRRTDVSRNLVQKVCRAIFDVQAAIVRLTEIGVPNPSGVVQSSSIGGTSGAVALLRANRVILLYALCSLLDGCLSSSNDKSSSSEPASAFQLVSLQSLCSLCTLLSLNPLQNHSTLATHALATIILAQIVSLESISQTPSSIIVPSSVQRFTPELTRSMTTWQHRNLLVRDAIFGVLCSHGGEAVESAFTGVLGGEIRIRGIATSEWRLQAVWSIQNHLLSCGGADEVCASLPMILALDDFCLTYPLELMDTPQALQRSIHVISCMQIFLWAYLDRIQRVLGADLKPFCMSLQRGYEQCRERMRRYVSEWPALTVEDTAIILTSACKEDEEKRNFQIDVSLSSNTLEEIAATVRSSPLDRDGLLEALLLGEEAEASPHLQDSISQVHSWQNC